MLSACKLAFDSLIKIIIQEPILAHYKQDIKTIVETDLLDYVRSGVFSQLGNDELVHHVAFFSQNFDLAKYNFEIYDKELLAIIRFLK